MDNSIKLIRASIYSFFCNYHTFASLATILIFPYSAATLLSASLIPSSPPSSSSSSLPTAVSHRFLSVFKATNFPLNSPLFDIISLKLSQTILSFLFALPFTLTFLTLSKATIIFAAGELPRHTPSPSLSSILHLYPPLLFTHLFTRFIILSTNVAVFSMFLIAFFVVDELGLTSTSSLFILSGIAAVIYSTTVANVLVICNLATIVAAMENCNGYTAVLKACVLIRGRAAVALFLALCSNLGMAAIEGLFQIRVIKIYNQNGSFDLSLVFEALTIIYLYSIFGVVDNIISCCFYKSCRYELLVKYAKFEGQGRGDLKI
ncbi:uncharacterized protein LOC110029208 [Phalaenopsis equestris]|uniref:uncharacterized protein LOC110029208 n=1 Tax=Phalaenopsis equestris TaxID=78828 RepID=UPI0009E439C6|nr:uncharacterized protein LOC110029208 [Phalaenopsis equestris]